MRIILIMLMVLAGLLSASLAQAELDLPGLARDSGGYAATLTRQFPQGAPQTARQAADQRAAAALAALNWPAAISALEQRVGMGNANATAWRNLAIAHLRRSPADPQRALQAAWQAWTRGGQGGAELPDLLIMADALRALDRKASVIEALRTAAALAPDNREIADQLAAAIKDAGMLIARTGLEANTDPARACVSFTVPPTKRADFLPADWVRLDPPAPGFAVTHEGDKLCISGLPSGRTTRLIFRSGLPGPDGLNLTRETSVDVAMPNRTPSIDFDSRLFVLPRGQVRSISVNTVNLSTVSLRLLRLTERNVAVLLRRIRLGEPLDIWAADYVTEEAGSEVWKGRADLPGYGANKTVRTALPLPETLQSAGPGLYALIATPGDGTRTDNVGAVQLILRTDLAPSIWRSTEGLMAQIRDYGTGLIRPDVRVRLVARNNDILAEATTDAEGVVRFAAPLLRGEGPLSPAALHSFATLSDGKAGHQEDFAALDLNSAAFDLSDRGVEGMPHPGPIDAYLWPDRGIYRPGETVNLMALVRDAAGQPADIPLHMIIRRPNGQIFTDQVPPRLADASLHLPLTLSQTAPTGVWTVELRMDPAAPPIGRTSFRVDAFLPESLAVDMGQLPAAIIPGRTTDLPLTARFLYGAPGAHLSTSATLRIEIDPAPFHVLAGHQIGVEGELFVKDQTTIIAPETDDHGATSLPVLIAKAPDSTHALKAQLYVSVADPAGRASHATLNLPIRPSGPLIGIKPLFPDRAINADTEAGFDIAAVTPEGHRLALNTRLRLIRERPDWRMVSRNGQAGYETVWRDEPMETSDLALDANGPTRFAKKLPFGRYRIEVGEIGGFALTTLRFRAGWADATSPDVPDKVDVSVDRRVIPAGETARIHIAAPFAGQGSVLVLTNKVHSLRNIEVPAGGTDIEIPVDAAWGPGAYVAVHVFRGGAGGRASRAIGLAHITVDPAARTLPLSIEAPAQVLPREKQLVVIRTTPGAFVSLAAVDEGILRLTSHLSPNPAPHFLGRRRLGLDLRDDWGRLIPPADGDATLLRQGGDDGGFALPEIPQRILSLFNAPVQAGPDGRAVFTLNLPDFAGEVRLMAVGWQGSRIGAAHAPMTIRDPVVAELLLPRFLAPGDEARLALLVQNLDLPKGEITLRLAVEGPLALDTNQFSVTLAKDARALPSAGLTATGIGRGVVRLSVTGPQGFSVAREAAITIRPARATQTLAAAHEMAPGSDFKLSPALERFQFGTGRASVSFGSAVRYNIASLLAALDAYGFACLEQSASRGLPLTLLPRSDATAAALQSAVSLVLEKQRYDGSFALWSGNGAPEEWLSAYAMEFLLRARTAGVSVPEPAITDGLKYLLSGLEQPEDTAESLTIQAYRLYVLALGGQGRPGAARVLLESIEKLPTRLARAQLGASLALAHDTPRAEAAFGAALRAPARVWWTLDYGSALRDQLALAVLLKESGVLAHRLPSLIATLPGADLNPQRLNTQEMAWAAAAGIVLGRTAAAPQIDIDGKRLTGTSIVLTAPATAHNAGPGPVWASVTTTGIPLQPLPAARAGLRIQRKFLAADGSDLNLDTLRQNTVFVLVLEGRAEDGQAHQIAITQGLPAGFEIAGRLEAGSGEAGNGEAGTVAGMSYLGKLTPTDAQPGADDRFAAIVSLPQDRPEFRVAVRLRVVTPGSFALPGAEVVDMYRPALFARQGEGRVRVAPAE